MITLGIETSCDETAVCLLETRTKNAEVNAGSDDVTAPRYRILENLIHSQADLHAKFGGVFPMMAKREHEKNLPILVEKILGKDGEKIKSAGFVIGRIAVTKGPGLEPALWAGIDFAKKLGEKLGVPVVGVNHMEGHILGSFLKSAEPSAEFTELIAPQVPALALLISGGHTELVLAKNLGEYEVVGRTKDDAAGEAFDKVARLLGLPYPGGPHVSMLAEQARNEMMKNKTVHFPRPMLHSADLDFSFSGLKTAVLYEIRKTDGNASMKPVKTDVTQNDKNKKGNAHDYGLSDAMKKEIAREFEDAVTEVLIHKTGKAIEKYGVQSLIAGGGVIANKHICEALKKLAAENSIPLFLPPAGVSGDNALMIALAGAFAATPATSYENNDALGANGNLSL